MQEFMSLIEDWKGFISLSDLKRPEGYEQRLKETIDLLSNANHLPPHRHQYDVEGREAPYEEIYFYQFDRPQGRGLIWQFDDETGMDQAFSLQTNDAAYMSGGYHPVTCMPGSTLYHLTLMVGPRRMSQASLHPDYRYLLDEKNLQNQYTPKT